MSPSVRGDYTKLKTDADRRSWLAQYVMDPKTATSTGFNRTTAVNSSMKVGNGQWLHESEIGGPRFLNDSKAAAVLCGSGELDARDSEFESLAKQGWKQFFFPWEMIQKCTGWKQEAGVEAISELKDLPLCSNLG